MPIDSVDEYNSSKVLDFDSAANKIAELKSENKTVGLCHGGFDLLHPGHTKHFESAKKLCDILFVSITSDRFVSELKGNGRPIFPDKLRAYSIAGIGFVDYVVIADFKKGVEVIQALKPSFYIKGPDYIDKEEQDPALKEEIEAVRSVGGDIKYTNDPKLSTTEMIKYIKDNIS